MRQPTGNDVERAVFAVLSGPGGEDLRDGPESWDDDVWNAIAKRLAKRLVRRLKQSD